MKRVGLAVAVLALAACGETAEPVAEDAAASAAAAYEGPAPGRYVVERKEEDSTSLSTMVVNDDGTYVNSMADGTKISGAISRRDEMDCFDPDGDEGETCWTRVDGEGGAFTATTEDGLISVAVKPQ